MLSDRITALFSLLQCSNTEIARFAGCSSGNISKLKTGNRIPKPTSRSIAALAEGVCGYADYENLLPVLAELCGVENTDREALIPALIGWLYETKDVELPSRPVTLRSKQLLAQKRRQFGERLDQVMTLLDLSNGQLASLLNIDVSLVSRYRTGVYSPHGNERLSERLSGLLADRAGRIGKGRELASLCGAKSETPDADAVTAWLYNALPEENKSAVARQLLRSLDTFVPGQGLPAAAPETPDVPIRSRYVGTEGLRAAVVRFLSDAAREGGELLLYSDEPMDWMTGDRTYFTLWASLMVKCVNSGVKIRIIHNVDRAGGEMVDAIKGWFPLYISGRIEPYVFRKELNPRFYHTVFLHPGKACIHGFFPMGAANDRSYDYITERAYLAQLKREYDAMLAAASPFLKTYTAAASDEFHRSWIGLAGMQDHLLSELPVFTAPERLVKRVLSRADMPEEQRRKILSRHRELRRQFEASLRKSSVNMILCLPEGEESRYFNDALSLNDLSVAYQPEEYAEHIESILTLVERERNFHLTLLPFAPFRDIQIFTEKDAVIVLRSREPCAAFVFLNPMLTESVSAYFSTLIEPYAEDRRTMAERLRKQMRQ